MPAAYHIPGFQMRRTPDGYAFPFLHYSADPDLTPEKVKDLRRKYTSQAFWNREMEGDAHSLDGQKVYPEFDPAVHVIPHSQVPKRGCLYMSIDPHPRTPHALLWVLVDRWSDWYVYREIWPSNNYADPRRAREDDQDNNTITIWEYAETIALLEGNRIEWHRGETDNEYGIYRENRDGERIVIRFMDQAGKAFMATGEGQSPENYAERYARFGIECAGPKKAHEAGEEAIHSLLKPRGHDLKGTWPRLHLSDRCPELKLEIMKHRYKRRRITDEREASQEGIEYRTHLLDNLRYLATSPNVCWAPSLESNRTEL